jgi:catechol 2,3-dioxygenase-like lactoylglutathione lyase family enzyme
MRTAKNDPPNLAKRFPAEWTDTEAATTWLREKMGAPAWARGDAQAMLHVLTFYGFVEQAGNQVRRAETTPDWPPPKPEPKPQTFIPITGIGAPVRNIEIKTGTIAGAPWASAYNETVPPVVPINRQ